MSDEGTPAPTATKSFDAKISELGDKLANLTLKEAVDLGNYMKETYGIEAAAGGAVMMAAAEAGPAAPVVEAQSAFDVVLKGVTEKIKVIKVVREITGLGLKEAKDLVETPNAKIKEGLAREEADELKKKLEENGAQVEVV